MVPADRGRASWADLVTFKMNATYDPEIPFLGGYLCKMPKMLNASWFVLAQGQRGANSLFHIRVVVARKRTMKSMMRAYPDIKKCSQLIE